MTDLNYRFTIRELTEDEGGGYWVEYPDLSYCASDGDTIEEAIENGRETLAVWLETAKEDGIPIPPPNFGYEPPNHSGQWRQRVPKYLHESLTKIAEKENVSLNTLVTSFIAEGIGRRYDSSS